LSEEPAGVVVENVERFRFAVAAAVAYFASPPPGSYSPQRREGRKERGWPQKSTKGSKKGLRIASFGFGRIHLLARSFAGFFAHFVLFRGDFFVHLAAFNLA
jgi:hypothetical protein